METNRLKQFCTVVESGSLTKASIILGITHSGLHKSLRVLENELGFELTMSKGRGIEITEQGLLFYSTAIEILRTVEKAFQKKIWPKLKDYKIGSLEVFLKFLPEKLLSEQQFLNYQVSFQEMAPGEIEMAVEEHKIDVGITYIPIPSKRVEYLQIAKFKMGIFCNQKKFVNTPFGEIPFVVPCSALNLNPLNINNTDGWKDGLFPRRVAYKASSLTTAVDIVKMGTAAVFMPIFLKNTFGVNLIELECPIDIEARHAFLVLRSNREESKEEKVLAKLLRQFLRVD